MGRTARAGILTVALILTFGILSAAPVGAATYKVTIQLDASTIRAGQQARVTGAVTPQTHGGAVALYRYHGGWHQVKSTVLGSRSKYAITFAPPGAGVFDYRVVWKRIPSRIVRLTVRAPVSSVWSSCKSGYGVTGVEPDFPIGSEVSTTAYLYVPSIFSTDGTTYPFTLKSIAYSTGVGDTNEWKCWIHVQIPVGYGPNHVEPLPASFNVSQVRVHDSAGHVITGWTYTLDSRHVSVVGVGIKEYGGDNGRPGTNTLKLTSLTALP